MKGINIRGNEIEWEGGERRGRKTVGVYGKAA